jgi:hypothetical protein
MGYRSEIAFCLSVDEVQKEDERGSHYPDYDRAKFKEMVGFFKLSKFYEIAVSPDYDLINHETEPNLGWKDGRIVFYASHWKWYEDHDIVIAYNEMWQSMQDIAGISGYFLRIGEERDDVEEEEFGDEPDNYLFAPFTGMSFDGENFLGKTETEENLTLLETKEK